MTPPPPRARGCRHHLALRSQRAPSTPASTGRTLVAPPELWQKTFDPREHGADVWNRSDRGPGTLRPPHARGGRHWPMPDSCLLPSTPACTGRTIPKLAIDPRCPFDPRKHGADDFVNDHEKRATLRPPQARGGHQPSAISSCRMPSTPACTGRTVAAFGLTETGAFDPRMHEADFGALAQPTDLILRPPQARGGQFS